MTTSREPETKTANYLCVPPNVIRSRFFRQCRPYKYGSSIDRRTEGQSAGHRVTRTENHRYRPRRHLHLASAHQAKRCTPYTAAGRFDRHRQSSCRAAAPGRGGVVIPLHVKRRTLDPSALIMNTWGPSAIGGERYFSPGRRPGWRQIAALIDGQPLRRFGACIKLVDLGIAVLATGERKFPSGTRPG